MHRGSPGGTIMAALTACVVLLSACGGGTQGTPAQKSDPKPAQSAPGPSEAGKPAAPAGTPAAAATSPASVSKPSTALTAPVPLNTLSGTVAIDGSSTVFPVSEAMAEEFQKATGGKVRVTVGISGTGGGFKKFCNGESDISDASRPILTAEIEACKEKSIEFVELPVAFDGLSILVSPRNTFVDCMTVSELKRMWEPGAQSTITTWNQIRPEWPNQPFHLYGAGADSGTFDYFTDAVNGKEKASRGDYTASEDDNVLVQGISSDPNALGYFGFAYYEENADKLKLVAVDNEKGGGCVKPTKETVSNGTYTPLSRPLLVYAKATSLDRPEVREFLRFYLDVQSAPKLIDQVGYIPFPDQYYGMALQRLNGVQTGTVFPGQSTLGVKLEDLFGKPPTLP
jgi:phosphate transport system substrate-binding protein